MALSTKQKVIKLLTPILLPIVKAYWRIFKPSTFGVKVIVEFEGKILIVRNSYGYKSLSFPGGRIDRGEKPLQAAIRETKEEVGISPAEIKYIGMITSTCEGKKDNIHIFHMTAPTPLIRMDEFEIAEAFWQKDMSQIKLGPVAKEIWDFYLEKTAATSF
jgi:8-oxo-dGTP pyrophosphatase MutT (NUDIX family)